MTCEELLILRENYQFEVKLTQRFDCKKIQNPRHHHRTSRERQSLFRVNLELINEIIAEIDLKGYYIHAS